MVSITQTCPTDSGANAGVHEPAQINPKTSSPGSSQQIDGPLSDLPMRQASALAMQHGSTTETSLRRTLLPAAKNGRVASAASTENLRTMTPGGPLPISGPSPEPRQPFNEMAYPGSRDAQRWPVVTKCLRWAREAGFRLYPTTETSCTVRNAVPFFDPESNGIRYQPDPQRGVGSIHLNIASMENETLAALTIIHEVTHAKRGARAHPATWDAYKHERLTDEGEAVYATLCFTLDAIAAGADYAQLTRDAAIAMPIVCIKEWGEALRSHQGKASEALYRELGEIYDKHVPQAAGWASAFEKMSTRLSTLPKASSIVEIK